MAAAHDPVFTSVGQALAFSFYIEQTQMATKGSTQIVIEDLLKRSGEWLDRVAPTERKMNVGNMSPLELRGQCAMVRSSVQDHLPAPERDSIHARFAYQIVRAVGVRGLRDHLHAVCVTQNLDAILAMLWAIYKPARRKGDEWSLRALEKQYSISKSTLGRDQQMLREKCNTLESMAQARLGELFERTGLVGDPYA